jgi:hypothetical protein
MEHRTRDGLSSKHITCYWESEVERLKLTWGALGAEGIMKAAVAWKQARAPTRAAVVLILFRGGVCHIAEEGRRREAKSRTPPRL